MQLNFTMNCIKKHFLKDTKYSLMIENEIMYLKNSTNKTKYSVELTLSTKISWQVKITGELEAFGLHIKSNEIKWFFGDFSELVKLKQLLAKKVLFYDLKDFFVAQQLIWKGKNCDVYMVNSKYDKKTKFISKCFEKKKMEFHIFEKSFNIMKSLNHENIDKLYEIYEGASTYYMILEQAKGKSLSQFIAESIKPINFILIKQIMKEALLTLQYLHSLEIIHRDIKPSNLFIFIPNKLNIQFKLIDFNLATRIQDLQYEMMRCGTPGYLAPEVINKLDVSKKYTTSCDIFSLGAVFYKLLTRKSLFRGVNEQEIYMANLKCRINLQGLAFFHISSGTIHLLSQMLEINPKERISAADALQHPYFKEQQEYESSQYLTKSKNYSSLAKSEQSLEYDLLKIDYFQNELPSLNQIPIIPKVKGGNRNFDLEEQSKTKKLHSCNPSYSFNC